MNWIFRRIPIFAWGLLAAIVGGGFFFLGSQPIPAEAALTTTTGVITDAARVTKKKRRRSDKVSFEFTVQEGSGSETKFKMPEGELSESELQSIMGQTVTVKHNGGDVFVLASSDRTLRSYEQSRQAEEGSNEFARKLGMGLVPLGLLIFAGGLWWRQRNTASA